MPKEEESSGREKTFSQILVELAKENWLSFILAALGLTLIVIGGIVMVRERGVSNTSGEVIFEEDQVGSEKIEADIQGAVLNPGVYELPASSRVQDLLIAAGGLSEEANHEWIAKNLNKAAKIKDGDKFYIPKKGEAQVEGVKSQGSDKVNVNSASLSELDSLPSIGSVRAQDIINGRPYARIEELLERKIIPASAFEKIKDKISVY